jgi:hypothetical protein
MSPTDLRRCNTCHAYKPADAFATADRGKCVACAVAAYSDKGDRRRSREAASYLAGFRAGQRAERAAIRAAIRERAAAL